jgi:hypothetical protein
MCLHATDEDMQILITDCQCEIPVSFAMTPTVSPPHYNYISCEEFKLSILSV